MKNGRNGNGHERFDELCALAMSDSLTAQEQSDLQQHLKDCAECREEYDRYLLLAQEGMPLLARRYARVSQEGLEVVEDNERVAIGSAEAGQRVLAPIAAGECGDTVRIEKGSAFGPIWRFATGPIVGAVAACLLVVASYGAYRFALRTDAAQQAESRAEHRADTLAAERRRLAEQLNAKQQRLTQLEDESSQNRSEVEHVKARLQAELEHESQRAAELTASLNTAASAAKARLEEQLQAASHDREVLSARLHEVETAHQSAQAELVSLRAERDRATLRLASLETDNGALVAANRDQERRLRNQEQYLASDRDIRELMGARQLYMADVFDVSSDSRTRKPYGRIFYTKSKSLIFYAFDLDRQPGIKNATFQAWGRNESSQAPPVSLGILYQDNEANRRWFLRLDDPKQLAEIDAVFVTVEPRGGSPKPTGKPFLYASLRREPNHP